MTVITGTGDLSPMLHQPALDNSPMIGGRSAKIIVDARGAYLAGNLRGLIERMDAADRDRLHVRMVEQAIGQVRRAVPGEAWHPSVQPIIEASTRALNMADRWLIERDP